MLQFLLSLTPANPMCCMWRPVSQGLLQSYIKTTQKVAFAIRKLSLSERNYPIHQSEFLSLKWAIVEKFHANLYGARFTVRTGNNPLRYALTMAKINAHGHRWLSDLFVYNFDIIDIMTWQKQH